MSLIGWGGDLFLMDWGGDLVSLIGWGGDLVSLIGWGGDLFLMGWGGDLVSLIGWGGDLFSLMGWGGDLVSLSGWGGDLFLMGWGVDFFWSLWAGLSERGILFHLQWKEVIQNVFLDFIPAAPPPYSPPSQSENRYWSKYNCYPPPNSTALPPWSDRLSGSPGFIMNFCSTFRKNHEQSVFEIYFFKYKFIFMWNFKYVVAI